MSDAQLGYIDYLRSSRYFISEGKTRVGISVMGFGL
jgi:hypothetical protein